MKPLHATLLSVLALATSLAAAPQPPLRKLNGEELNARENAFAVLHGAFLAQYRFALEFIRLAENDPGIAALLDDPVPELGLP